MALKEGDGWTKEIIVPATTTRDPDCLRVTLVYTDRPGNHLQNLLILTVIAVDGSVRRGDEGYLAENNVQQVVWI